MGVHCVHAVHSSADFSLWLDSPTFWAPGTKACSPIRSRLFPVSPGRKVRYGCTGWNQGQSTVPSFRYVFLKQYCDSELKGQGKGRGYVSRRTAHGRRFVREWLLLLGVRRYIIFRSTGWILMVFGGVLWLDGLWLRWIYSKHRPNLALSLR